MDHRDVVFTGGADALDLAEGDDRGDCGGIHRAALLVDDEAAVGVAVEREPEVGAVLDDGALQVDEVRRLERVRLVVREGAVEFEVQRNDLEGQCGQPGGGAEHRWNGESAHAVAGVDHDLERPDAAEVDERAKVRGVVGEHVDLGDGTRCCDIRDALLEVVGRAVADRRKPGVERDALCARSRELDAVVRGGVVAGREHRRRCLHRPGGEVGLVGRAEADRHDVGATPRRTARECGGETRRGVAHVVTDDDSGPRCADLVDEARGERLDRLLRESLPDDSADVVGLHDRVEARASLGWCSGIHALKPTSPSETCRTSCQPTGADVRSAWRAHRS